MSQITLRALKFESKILYTMTIPTMRLKFHHIAQSKILCNLNSEAEVHLKWVLNSIVAASQRV